MFVAICDADTWYPPHYLKRAGQMMDEQGDGCVAASAWLRPENATSGQIMLHRFHRLSAARIAASGLRSSCEASAVKRMI